MGEVISRSAMRDVVDIMALLRVAQEKGKRGIKSIYENDFEPVFLKKSEEFYTEEAESSLQTLDASTYLRLVCFFLLTSDDDEELTDFSLAGGATDTRRTRSVLCISRCIHVGCPFTHPRRASSCETSRHHPQYAGIRSGRPDRR